MIVGNTQFREGAQHTFRRLTAQLCRFNFKIARQYGADGRNGNLKALTAVRRAADDIQQTFAADVDFCHAQLVGIRVLSALDHFANNNAVKTARDRLNAVNLKPGHRYLVRQRFAIDSWVNPLA